MRDLPARFPLHHAIGLAVEHARARPPERECGEELERHRRLHLPRSEENLPLLSRDAQCDVTGQGRLSATRDRGDHRDQPGSRARPTSARPIFEVVEPFDPVGEERLAIDTSPDVTHHLGNHGLRIAEVARRAHRFVERFTDLPRERTHALRFLLRILDRLEQARERTARRLRTIPIPHERVDVEVHVRCCVGSDAGDLHE